MKKFIYLILTFFSLLQTAHAENNSMETTSKQTGLTLDIERHFYPADVIKKFIDSIAEAKGNYIHSHLLDDENYAIESTYLDQLEQNATEKEGIFYNNKTNKPFLTYKQIDDIIHYAKDRNIELIPEVDRPGHMKGIFTLLRLKYGDEFVKKITSKLEPNELDITNPEAIETIKTLIGKVIYIFAYSAQHFHAGGDKNLKPLKNDAQFVPHYLN